MLFRYILWSLLLSLVGPMTVKAQLAPRNLPTLDTIGVLEFETARGLNSYVYCANEIMHNVSILHDKLEDYNLALNNFYLSRIHRFDHFPVQLFAQKQKGRSQSAQAAYNVTMTFGKQGITFQRRQLLDDHLNCMMKYAKEIERRYNVLCNYSQSDEIKEDERLDFAYNQLFDIVMFFENLRLCRDRLEYQLFCLHQLYVHPDADSIELKSFTYVLGLQQGHRQVIDALEKKNHAGVSEALERYRKLIAEVQAFQRDVLIAYPCEEETKSHTPCLEVLFDSLMYAATDVITHAEDYLNKKQIPGYYENLGADYFYRNHRFLNPAWSYGEGRVALSNQMTNLREVPLLALLDVPKIFKALDIRKYEKPPKLMDKDSIVEAPVKAPKRGLFANYVPNNIILLLDVSKSMNQPGKLPLLKASMLDLLGQMREEDQLSIIVYSGGAEIVLKPTSARDHKPILEAINSLKPRYYTDADEGLKMAYKLAKSAFIWKANNRVLLATDGAFKLERRSHRLIYKRYKKNYWKLSVFMFEEELSPRNEAILNRISEDGKGNYYRITPYNLRPALIHELQVRYEDLPQVQAARRKEIRRTARKKRRMNERSKK